MCNKVIPCYISGKLLLKINKILEKDKTNKRLFKKAPILGEEESSGKKESQGERAAMRPSLCTQARKRRSYLGAQQLTMH